MKFEDVKFPGKNQFRKEFLRELLEVLNHNPRVSVLSPTRVRRYCDVLIDDQHFNPRTLVFYDKVTNLRLDVEFLAEVAMSYIFEHMDEFRYAH